MSISRAVFVALGVTLSAPLGRAQSCLVQGEPAPPALKMLGSTVQATLSPVQPAGRVSVILFPTAIAPGDRTRAETELAALYRAGGKSMQLKLVVFDGRQFAATVAASTPAAWGKLIHGWLYADSAADQGQQAQPPVSTNAIYAALAAAISGFGGEWASVLLVGLPPEPDTGLRDYAMPWLTSLFCGNKLRLSYWNPDGRRTPFWNQVAAATGGASSLENLSEFPEWMRSGPLAEARWPDPPVRSGFVLDGPNLFAAPGTRLPGLDQFAALRRDAAEAAALVQLEKPSEAQVQRTRDLLQSARRINPLDAETLRAGASYYERYHDFKTAAGLLGELVQAHSDDAALLAELGHDCLLAGDAEAARGWLVRARRLKASAAVAEDLASIHLAQHQDREAMPFLQEALALAPRRADLWFARADAARRLGDWVQEASSLDNGIAAEPANLARRTSLIQLYLDKGIRDKALAQVNQVSSALPADAAVLRRYAEFLDRLERRKEALDMWKKALASDPRMEPAHFRIARLLLDDGNLPQALAAAETGISAAPQSARLRVVKSEALERQGRYFEARGELRVAAKSLHDADLLARLAQMEDISGSHAAAAYAAAADTLPAGAPESEPLLERGLEVGLRDGDAKAASDFRRRLIAIHQARVAAWLLEAPEISEAATVVPGGLEALAFIAHGQPVAPPRFFAEYCRTLINRSNRADHKATALYLDNIQRYFERLTALKALGSARGGRTELAISTADKRATQKTEKVLDLLGWRLRGGKAQPGERLSEAGRQEVASALALDGVAMQEAVAARCPFTFTIEDGTAPVVLGEAKWLATFFPKEKLNGGMAEALARDLRIAKTYAALAEMGDRARNFLLSGIELKTLAEKQADLIYRYSSSFALHGSHAAVPGGAATEPVWEKLVGSPPASPARFFRGLLEKDDGKLLAFFDLLGQLDALHQRFLTASAGRTGRFYDLYRESRDLSHDAAVEAHSSSYLEFLQQIPLDADLHVLFPGSPEVWMLAKGKSDSARANRLARKLSRITVPEEENDILIRLLATRYKSKGERFSESDNFVSVVRIDRHRADPLDENSALLLAQHYATAGSTYPYFASLTALRQADFERFFAMVDQWGAVPRLQLNLLLGQLHSLIELLCLFEESGAIPPKTAAELLGSLCERYTKAGTPDMYAAAALDTVRDLLVRLAPKDAAGADDAIERILLPPDAPVVWEANGVHHEVDSAGLRRAAYRKILAEQKVTRLQPLLDCERLLRELGEGQPAAERLKTLDSLQASLLSVPPPKQVHMTGAEQRLLEEYNTGRAAAVLARLKQHLGRKKVKLEEIKKLRLEYLGAISAQVKLALSGIVYARFLDPDDLLIANDPLLLRKHQFLSLEDGDTVLFPGSDIARNNEGAGSHFVGGFAEFYQVAGWTAVSGEKPGTSQDVEAAQIGSLRATAWSRFREDDLRLFGLRTRLAREWVLHAGADDGLLEALADETLGLLSPARRARLLDAIAARDWESAMRSFTLSDAYGLSGRYLARYANDPWHSPVTAALRASSAADSARRLRSLGAASVELLGCSHPHLEDVGPYEEYERLLMPVRLSERAAEFKLYLADVADRAGIPPAALGAVAEPLARAALAKAKMADIRDWRAVVAAFAALEERTLEAAFEGQK